MQYDYKGLTITIEQDSDPSSPREWDNAGTMVCFHRRYWLGDTGGSNRREEHGEYQGLWNDPDDFEQWWEENGKGGIRLPLYLYDHSGITMSCGPFGDPWDSGQVGWIFITRNRILREWGGHWEDNKWVVTAKRVTKQMREKAEKLLRDEVETYDQYLTGDIYGYTVEDEDGRHLDSCWGYYGEDDCRKNAEEAADYQLGLMKDNFVGAGI